MGTDPFMGCRVPSAILRVWAWMHPALCAAPCQTLAICLRARGGKTLAHVELEPYGAQSLNPYQSPTFTKPTGTFKPEEMAS